MRLGISSIALQHIEPGIRETGHRGRTPAGRRLIHRPPPAGACRMTLVH